MADSLAKEAAREMMDKNFYEEVKEKKENNKSWDLVL